MILYYSNPKSTMDLGTFGSTIIQKKTMKGIDFIEFQVQK